MYYIGDYVAASLECMRQHRVFVEGRICAVLVTTMMLEGMQRKLHPDLELMDVVNWMCMGSSLSHRFPILKGLIDRTIDIIARL